jgi:hypothetical protein
MPSSFLISTRARYKQGITIRAIPVAKRIPNPRLIAIGIKNLACREVSNIIGASPKKVVRDVSIIGLNLLTEALKIES